MTVMIQRKAVYHCNNDIVNLKGGGKYKLPEKYRHNNLIIIHNGNNIQAHDIENYSKSKSLTVK